MATKKLKINHMTQKENLDLPIKNHKNSHELKTHQTKHTKHKNSDNMYLKFLRPLAPSVNTVNLYGFT
jgi:hypothetical protein